MGLWRRTRIRMRRMRKYPPRRDPRREAFLPDFVFLRLIRLQVRMAIRVKSGHVGVMTKTDTRGGSERPLKSWKEIAHFFGRDERTVKRWEEKRGLPVYRLPGETKASVYAYPTELQVWLTGHRDTGIAVATPQVAGEVIEAGPGGYRAAWGRRALLAGFGAAALSGAVYVAVASVPNLLSGRNRRPAKEELSADREARDLYLSGLYQLNLRTEAGLNRSVQLFTAAIANDPGFAAAFAGLAKAYNLLSQYTLMPAEQAYPLAKVAAKRALRLDPALAAAHAALGFTEFYWDRDFARSLASFETALALDPDSAETNHWFALTEMQLGDFDAALSAIRRAQELNPQSRSILANKALILYHAGELAEARAILEQFVASTPDYVAPRFYLADLSFDEGRYPDFLAHAHEAARIRKDRPMLAIVAAAEKGYRAGDRTGLLEAMLAEGREQNARGLYPAYKLARTLALLNRTDDAVSFLAEAVASREPDTLGIKIDSAFAALHDEPRFRDLAAKVGYTDLTGS